MVGKDRYTGGFMLFEDELVGGKTTPLHHHSHEESFYVSSGSIRLYLDRATPGSPRGGFAVVPREVPHAFLVTSDQARVLSLHTPAGGEAFFRAASEPVEPGGEHPGVDFTKVVEAGTATGAMTVVGPPPF